MAFGLSVLGSEADETQSFQAARLIRNAVSAMNEVPATLDKLGISKKQRIAAVPEHEIAAALIGTAGLREENHMHDHWRDKIKVHPAADLFPMMSDAELDALAKDIAEHGMHQGIVLWTPEWTITADIEAGWKADFEAGRVPCGLSLLDGRNRLAAIERAFDDPGQRKAALSVALRGGFMALGVSIAQPRHLNAHTDPFAFVISANIHRRHLTAEQKRKIVAQVLRADPERSNRQVAEMVKVGHPTVARVRQGLEASGDVEHRSTRTDSKGRQQPAKKPSRPTVAAPAPLQHQRQRANLPMSWKRRMR